MPRCSAQRAVVAVICHVFTIFAIEWLLWRRTGVWEESSLARCQLVAARSLNLRVSLFRPGGQEQRRSATRTRRLRHRRGSGGATDQWPCPALQPKCFSNAVEIPLWDDGRLPLRGRGKWLFRQAKDFLEFLCASNTSGFQLEHGFDGKDVELLSS